ncbi:MAG TPA: HEAT repeat domain-containing protein [Candidatus Wallbacteria bacterium]|nr:HEAT repeat domain-containing protein [Candidatus Wallbacteria bacterium]
MNKQYEITRMLKSDDLAVREYALGALTNSESLLPSIVEELYCFLSTEKEPALKLMAIKILGDKKADKSLTFFKANIDSCDAQIKIAMYDSLSKFQSREALEFALERYREEKAEAIRSKVVRTAAVIARTLGTDIGGEMTLEFLRDADARVRANACSIKLDPENALLKTEYKKKLYEGHARLTAEAAIALYESGEHGTLDFISGLIPKALTASEKASYAYALGRMPSPESSALLIGLLSDADGCVRAGAISSLGALREKSAIKDLFELYFLEFTGRRENLQIIINSMKKIDELHAAYALHYEINIAHDNAYRKATLIKLFSHFAPAELSNNFKKFLEDADARVRANAVEGVLTMKERGVIDRDFVIKNLFMSTCDGNPRVAANAIFALYKCGMSGIISVLREMLNSRVENVRRAAEYARGYFPECVVWN